MELPEDDFILLSVINMKLRDGCPSLEELCFESGWEYASVTARLKSAGYVYSEEKNRVE
ncbi:MAG: DUF4250 domain-containing protein [Clostridia bacterium]|nr:DUF4250 domain-containing protein [Clostridia bacterium]